MSNILRQMTLTEFSNLCRICCSKVNVVAGVNIFDEGGDLRQVYKKIAECLPVEVNTEDKLPKMVCEECSFKLDQFCDFRDRSVKSEMALNDMLKSMYICDEMPLEMESLICQAHDEALKVASGNVQKVDVDDVAGNLDEMVIKSVSSMSEPNNLKLETEHALPEFGRAHQDYILSDSIPLTLPEDQLVLPEPSISLTESDLSKANASADKDKVTMSGDWIDCCEGCGKAGAVGGHCNDCMQEAEIDAQLDNGSKGKTCPHCCKVYKSNYKLAQHMWRHTGEKPFKCLQCDKTFRSRIGLSQHQATHTGKYDYSCNTCGKGFQCKSYLKVHQKVHSNDRPYPCDTCGSSFKSKQTLLDHRNRHLGLKPYLCEVCGRGFITKGLCKTHQKVHSGTNNKQYPCHICNKLFVSKSYLAIHIRIHTGEKPYMCEVCGKGFLTRVDLRIHSTVHTGEKSFICEMCGKAFARRDALRCHRRSHTGERPYRCDICGQSFTQFSPMAIHKRLHTGERPYSCDLCDKAFVSKSTMMTHRKRHSNQQRTARQEQEEAPSTSNDIGESVSEVSFTQLYVVASDEVTGYLPTVTLVDTPLQKSTEDKDCENTS